MISASVNIGTLLKAKRLDMRLTRAALAEMSGVSASSIANIENGIQSPSLDTIVRLSEALSFSPLEIVARAMADFASVIAKKQSNRDLE